MGGLREEAGPARPTPKVYGNSLQLGSASGWNRVHKMSQGEGVFTFRDGRRMVGQVKGVRLGLIVTWNWRRVCAGAAVANAVVVAGVGGRESLLGSDPALSDLFLVPSLPSFSAWKGER